MIKMDIGGFKRLAGKITMIKTGNGKHANEVKHQGYHDRRPAPADTTPKHIRCKNISGTMRSQSTSFSSVSVMDSIFASESNQRKTDVSMSRKSPMC
jgi:hypothetical protein